MLQTMQPASLNAIRSDGWEEVEMTVDSGASETVVGEDMIVTANLKESEGSRRGIEYKVANGESIPQLGRKEIPSRDTRRSQKEYHRAGVFCAARSSECKEDGWRRPSGCF